jgi:hypothetical protein
VSRDAITVLREATRHLPNEVYVEACAAIDAAEALADAVDSYVVLGHSATAKRECTTALNAFKAVQA